MNVTKYTRRHLPLVSLAIACLLWGVAQFIFPITTMVRALFIPMGIALSLPLYYVTTKAFSPESSVTKETPLMTERRSFAIDNLHAAKGLTILGFLSVAATVWLDSRLLPLFTFLLIGYTIVVAQFWSNPSPGPLLFDIVLLFTVPVFVTYLTTGIFFGGGDTFAHIRAINSLLANDAIVGIRTAEVAYSQYPGFHIVVGILVEFTGLATYDAIILAGIVLVGALIVFTYAAINKLFDSKRVALGSALGVTLLSIVTYYTNYFYPQSMAVVLLSGGLYLYASLRTTTDSHLLQRYVGLTVVLVGLMVLTHHLTFLLFGIAVVTVLGVAILRQLILLSDESNLPTPPPRYINAFPVMLGYAVLTAYWIFSSSQFLGRVADTLRGEGSGGGPENVMFGVTPPDQFLLAIDWLVSINGLHKVAMLALIAVAAYEIVDSWKTYRNQLTILVGGLLFAGLLLPLPVSVNGLNRFRFAVVLFAVIPLGVALVRLGRVQGKSLAVVLLLVALMGTTTAFVPPLANDIDSLHNGERRIQVAYDANVYDKIGSAGLFVDTHAETPVTTRWLMRRAILAQGSSYDNYQNLRLSKEGLIASRGILLVREGWTKHKITTEYGSFVVSEERFDSSMGSQNKIYTNSEVYGLWQTEDYTGVFGG